MLDIPLNETAQHITGKDPIIIFEDLYILSNGKMILVARLFNFDVNRFSRLVVFKNYLKF